MNEQESEHKRLIDQQKKIQQEICLVEEKITGLKEQANSAYRNYVILGKERDILKNALQSEKYPQISAATLRNELKTQEQTLQSIKRQIDTETVLVDKLRKNISTVHGAIETYCVAFNGEDSSIRTDSETVYFPSLYERKARAYEFEQVMRDHVQLFLGIDAKLTFYGPFEQYRDEIISQALELQMGAEPGSILGFFERDGLHDLFTKSAIYEFAGRPIPYNLTEMPVKSPEHAESILKQVMRQEECVVLIKGKFRAALSFGDIGREVVLAYIGPDSVWEHFFFLDLHNVLACEKQLEDARQVIKCLEIGGEYGT